MDNVPAYGKIAKTKGRGLPVTADDRLGAIRDDRERYPRWTPSMVDALPRLRAQGGKWFQLYDKIADEKTLAAAWKRIDKRTQGAARGRGAGVLAPLGLTLSPEKTRITHLDEGFDFLGWHYKGRQRWPRDKSVKAFRQKVKVITRRKRPGSMEAICTELKPRLRGFYHYFRNGNSAGAFSQITGWLRRRLRGILRKRQNGKSGISTRLDHFTWPNAFFAAKGLFDLEAHLVTYRREHLHSPVRG